MVRKIFCVYSTTFPWSPWSVLCYDMLVYWSVLWFDYQLVRALDIVENPVLLGALLGWAHMFQVYF